MAKQTWAKDLKPGMQGQDLFLLLDLKEMKASNGKPYILAKLMDKTGEFTAKKWETSLSECPVKVGEVTTFGFSVGDYKGKPDVKISSFEPTDSADIDMNDFVKASKYKVSEMWPKFVNYIYNYESSYFSAVAQALFDPESIDLFQKAPAATMMHHAFTHGLLEHTLQMLQCADLLLSQPFFMSENLNADLCMFGVMFHDFGKIYEYSCEPGFKIKPQGVLVAHIPMVAARIYEEANRCGVPEEVRDHMMHVVLAHHGLVAWGSPNKPACPEAVFVHHIDNLHGSVFGVLQAREAATTETFKYGFGEQQLTLLKKPFNDILKECEVKTDGF